MQLTTTERRRVLTDFPDLLRRFAAAVAANDGAALAALFTPGGVYDDGFFGEYRGRQAIADMLAHFHDTGANFRWDFLDPLSDGRTGYARYRFSYASRMPGAEGRPVVFEGIGFFQFRDGLIARYAESFDRGMALAQQDFAPERIKKVLLKLAARQNATEAAQEHLKRLA
jgi:SnoaL-like domain